MSCVLNVRQGKRKCKTHPENAHSKSKKVFLRKSCENCINTKRCKQLQLSPNHSSVFGKKLHAVNLCEQSESSDLFGGFKPVEFGFSVIPLVEEFRALCSTEKNKEFLGMVANLLHSKKWPDLLNLLIQAADIAMGEKKKRRVKPQWTRLKKKLELVKRSLNTKAANMFAYVDGVLTTAMKNGDWVLLDEINLAEAETLIREERMRQFVCNSQLQDKPDF
jgi:midasin (ATPase involved in ribosome maturation)